MQTLLYQVKPSDPVTFIAVPFMLLLVSFAAACIPALRAMKVSPLIALRTQ
jgi:putative ABC transport system permease protein